MNGSLSDVLVTTGGNAYPTDGYAPYVRPQIVCMDGATISVQASKFHYSTPRSAVGPYSEVEVGFPTPDFPEGAQWKDDTEAADCDAVFAYVPIKVVSDWIESHGGYSHMQAR